MSGKTWIVFDGNYVAWRAYHTTGSLSLADVPTGVAFGFFRTIMNVSDYFASSRLVFCFDRKPYKRSQVFPGYKVRKSALPEDVSLSVRSQIDTLRCDYLPALGFNNVFHQPGYESDDGAAMVCNGLPESDSIVLISADKDLYQLLDEGRVVAYNPATKVVMTEATLAETYGVTPYSWIAVKAIAGCVSDTIPGVSGVGEKIASMYVNGKLKLPSKSAMKIEEAKKLIVRNLKLVELPFPGMKVFTPQQDYVTADKWRKLTEKLGMRSLNRRSLLFKD